MQIITLTQRFFALCVFLTAAGLVPSVERLTAEWSHGFDSRSRTDTLGLKNKLKVLPLNSWDDYVRWRSHLQLET